MYMIGSYTKQLIFPLFSGKKKLSDPITGYDCDSHWSCTHRTIKVIIQIPLKEKKCTILLIILQHFPCSSVK